MTIDIFYHRAIRYIKVGLLLHTVSILGFICFFSFARQAASTLGKDQTVLLFVQTYLCLYGLVLIAFAQKDAFSRFQNYKRVKDLFFEKGFNTRIVNLFVNSRCQRDAIKIAAHDLGMKTALKTYYARLGYRWYHLLPDIVFSQPTKLATARFWKNTLFVPRYQSKYFLW